jgi:hypothetical protein
MVTLPKAARLLGFRLRILPAAWMNVPCERCVVQVIVSATAAWMNVSCERCVVHFETSAMGRALVQGCPTDCVYVVQCDHVKQ